MPCFAISWPSSLHACFFICNYSLTAYCRALVPFRLLLSVLQGLHAFSDTPPHLRTSVWFATNLGSAQHWASPSSRVIAISARGQAVVKGQSELISRVDSDMLSSLSSSCRTTAEHSARGQSVITAMQGLSAASARCAPACFSGRTLTHDAPLAARVGQPAHYHARAAYTTPARVSTLACCAADFTLLPLCSRCRNCLPGTCAYC